MVGNRTAPDTTPKKKLLKPNNPPAQKRTGKDSGRGDDEEDKDTEAVNGEHSESETAEEEGSDNSAEEEEEAEEGSDNSAEEEVGGDNSTEQDNGSDKSEEEEDASDNSAEGEEGSDHSAEEEEGSDRSVEEEREDSDDEEIRELMKQKVQKNAKKNEGKREKKVSNSRTSGGKTMNKGKKSKKKIVEDEEEDSQRRDGSTCTFPMNRIYRIMKDQNGSSKISQEAIFLANKASEKFLELFCREAYACAFLEHKSQITYDQLASVVSKRERFEFLLDMIPERVKAEDALARYPVEDK